MWKSDILAIKMNYHHHESIIHMKITVIQQFMSRLMAQESVYVWASSKDEPKAEFSSGGYGAVVANSCENEKNLQLPQGLERSS